VMGQLSFLIFYAVIQTDEQVIRLPARSS
jgi:hypothetical protein